MTFTEVSAENTATIFNVNKTPISHLYSENAISKTF